MRPFVLFPKFSSAVLIRFQFIKRLRRFAVPSDPLATHIDSVNRPTYMTQSESARNRPRKTIPRAQVRSEARLSQCAWFCAIFVLLPRGATAQTNVVTQHNDNARTGANINE